MWLDEMEHVWSVKAWNTTWLICMVMSISDDGTQDLIGPAKRDEGIRVHTIHEFAVTHAWCSVGLWTFEDLFGYFECVNFCCFHWFCRFVDLWVWQHFRVLFAYFVSDLGVLVKGLNSAVCVWGEWFLYARLKNGRIMLWQCPSVCPSVRPSVRPSFPDFFSTCFEISIWNLVYAFSRWHDMSSLSFITIGSLWPSLQPKVGQTQFLQSWPYKSR